MRARGGVGWATERARRAGWAARCAACAWVWVALSAGAAQGQERVVVQVRPPEGAAVLDREVALTPKQRAATLAFVWRGERYVAVVRARARDEAQAALLGTTAPEVELTVRLEDLTRAAEAPPAVWVFPRPVGGARGECQIANSLQGALRGLWVVYGLATQGSPREVCKEVLQLTRDFGGDEASPTPPETLKAP